MATLPGLETFIEFAGNRFMLIPSPNVQPFLDHIKCQRPMLVRLLIEETECYNFILMVLKQPKKRNASPAELLVMLRNQII